MILSNEPYTLSPSSEWNYMAESARQLSGQRHLLYKPDYLNSIPKTHGKADRKNWILKVFLLPTNTCYGPYTPAHECARTTHKYLKIKIQGKMQQSMQIFAVPNTEAQGNLAVLTRLNCDPMRNSPWVTANITPHWSRHTEVQRLQGKQQSPCRPSKPSSYKNLTYESQNWLHKSTMALARTGRMCSGTPKSLLAEQRTLSLFLEEYYYKCWSGSKVNSWNPSYCGVWPNESNNNKNNKLSTLYELFKPHYQPMKPVLLRLVLQTEIWNLRMKASCQNHGAANWWAPNDARITNKSLVLILLFGEQKKWNRLVRVYTALETSAPLQHCFLGRNTLWVSNNQYIQCESIPKTGWEPHAWGQKTSK